MEKNWNDAELNFDLDIYKDPAIPIRFHKSFCDRVGSESDGTMMKSWLEEFAKVLSKPRVVGVISALRVLSIRFEERLHSSFIRCVSIEVEIIEGTYYFLETMNKWSDGQPPQPSSTPQFEWLWICFDSTISYIAKSSELCDFSCL